MALKDLVERLKNRGADTPDASEKNTRYQKKVSVYAGCTTDTPDTPRFVDTAPIVQVGLFADAANDPAPEPPADSRDWRDLAGAYNRHHFKCSACIAAGKGYGMRCVGGAALWDAYQRQP